MYKNKLFHGYVKQQWWCYILCAWCQISWCQIKLPQNPVNQLDVISSIQWQFLDTRRHWKWISHFLLRHVVEQVSLLHSQPSDYFGQICWLSWHPFFRVANTAVMPLQRGWCCIHTRGQNRFLWGIFQVSQWFVTIVHKQTESILVVLNFHQETIRAKTSAEFHSGCDDERKVVTHSC